MSSAHVWSANIAIHKGFVEGLVCNQCRNIPKKGFGRICENNHIYCNGCVEQLIKQNSTCNVNCCNKNIKEPKGLPRVLQHMIDGLQVTCFNKYCKWNGTLSLLDNHLLQCNNNTHDNDDMSTRRRLTTDNIIYNDTQAHQKWKTKQENYSTRRRTSSTNSRDDALKQAQKYAANQANKTKKTKKTKKTSKSKARQVEIGCALLSQGCLYKMDIKQINKMDQHFKDYQHKHLMLIINDYQEKYQSLENSVLILQSQMKFVLNELNSANKMIESQSKQIEFLNNKINTNIMNQTAKPPKKDEIPSLFTQTLQTITKNEEIAETPKFNVDDEIKEESSYIYGSYLNSNKSKIIAAKFGAQTLCEHNNECGESAVIIDNGSGVMKYGYSNKEIPETFPTIIGHGDKLKHINKGSDIYYIGNKAIKNEKFVNLQNNIIENGIINDWDAMEKIWWYIFKDKLKIDPANDCKLVLMSESLMNDAENREKITQIMFEQFNINSFYLCPDVILSLHATGNLSGTVIESGYGHTTIAPIFEGIPFKLKSININNISGNIVNKWLENNVLSYSLCLNNMYNQKISKYKKEFVINNVKENFCYVSMDNNNDSSKCYQLPDGYNIFSDENGDIISSIWLNEERFKCTEKCIMNRLPDLINSSIDSCLNDVKSLLYKNIIISGGNTMFNGFNPRIKKELIKKCNYQYNNGDINIITNKYQQYQCFKGASIISCINTIDDIVINKNQYNEYGPSIIRYKCI